MKIINILFNYKKSTHDNQILGVERCFIDYARYLTKLGHRVFSVLKNDMVYVDEIKKYSTKTLEMRGFGQGDIFSIARLAWLFWRENPGVILCHSGRALFFARMARILYLRYVPIVVINHGVRVEKFLKADYVFAVNNYFTRELVAKGMKKGRAIAIPNMIEVPKNFTPITKPEFRQPLKIGSLGRLYPEKFFDKVIRAIAILKQQDIECEYVIGGVGPEQAHLERLSRELDVEKNFKILGWTKDKKTFFENIDIFILPSWGETFGIVLLEAMLYNTPIITSNSWGPDEIIDHEIDGLKVSKDDFEKMPQLLADEILRLKNDQDFARELAANAHKKFFAKYSAEVVSKKLEELLQKIVDREI